MTDPLPPAEIERRWHAQIAENARLRQELAAANQARAEAVERCERAALDRISRRINMRMNDYLCELQPDYDNSVVGFNEAWNIVRDTFAEIDAALQPDPKPAQGDAAL